MAPIARPFSHRQKIRAAQRRRNLYQLFAVVGVGLLLAALALSLPRPVSIAPARVGAPASNFALTDLSGETVQLTDYAGQVVLVNGWATWCPPCRAEMPALHEFYLAHQAEGFALLAVNAGEDRATVADFIAQTGFTFPVLLDPGENISNGLGVNGLPTSILIGRDGKVAYIHVGYFTPEVLAEKVTPLLR